MAATVIGGAGANSGAGTTTSQSVSPAAGAAAGDLAVLVGNIGAGSAITMSVPAGWNQILAPTANGSSTAQIGIWWKFLSGNGSTTGDWAANAIFIGASAARQVSVGLTVYRGAAYAAVTSIGTGSATTSLASGAVTPAMNDAILTAVNTGSVTASATTLTQTPPAGYTEQVDTCSTQAGVSRKYVGMHTKVLSGQAGLSQGAATATGSTNSDFQSVHIVIAPADATVSAPAATATAAEAVPAVSVTANATVTAPAATATGTDPAPAPHGNANVAAPAATGSGSAPAPGVSAGGFSPNVTINAPAATASAAEPAPAGAGGASASPTPGTASGRVEVPGISAGSVIAVNPMTGAAEVEIPSIRADALVGAGAAIAVSDLLIPTIGGEAVPVKFRLDRPGTWIYPSIRVKASDGDVIQSTYQIDRYWTEVDEATAATIPPPSPVLTPYSEVPDGAFLVYSREANSFIPSVVAPFDDFGRLNEEGVPEYLTQDNLDTRYATAAEVTDDISDAIADLSNVYFSLATRTRHAPALRMWFPEAEGALGNGTHDDAAAITAAVTACSAAGGGTVYLGAATYNISGSIVLPSNVELRGVARGITTVRPHNSTYAFSLIRNYRATQTSGSNDTDIAVRDLCLDGRSTGNSDDSRRGYGIELYGSTRATVERVLLLNIPLSGIEVSGNYAGVAVNGVGAGTPPNAETVSTTIRDVVGQHIGWQEPFLTGTPLTQWGDAGFGVIGRSNVRGLVVENVQMRDVEVNGIGVGQMDSQNNTGDPPTTAHCSDVQITNCLVDQSAASGTVSAPSFRVAFTARATLTNCIAIGNATSVGFNVRAAGTSFTRRVTLVGCIAENNVAGFQVTGKDAVTSAQHVTLSACIAKGNTSEGFRTQNAHVALIGCHSINNGTHGFWLQYVSGSSITSIFDTTVVGCHAKDNGTSGTQYGFLLDGCSAVVLSGCVAADTRSGGSRTQSYGIREINSAGNNSLTGNVLRNNATANIGTLGTGTVSTGNVTL